MASAGLALATLATLAACSPPSGPANAEASGAHFATSLTDLFADALAGKPPYDGYTLSAQEVGALERAVASGTITAADYEASWQAWDACLRSHGVDQPWRKQSDGVYYRLPLNLATLGITSEQDAAADLACDSLRVVPSLYAIQQTNPTLLTDTYQVAVLCLRREGIVDTAYTSGQLQADLAKPEDERPFDVFHGMANECLMGAGLQYFDASQTP